MNSIKENKTLLPSYLNFKKEDYAWRSDINYRDEPEAYRVGKGEQGVLICEPYKSEIGPHWRFKTPEIARLSSAAITALFLSYLENGDFIGADMARKYLQMGYTRARRYANYKGGKKYDADNGHQLLERGTGEPEKAAAASIFYAAWKAAEAHAAYREQKASWIKRLG